jgi:hypothetical protein
MYSPLKASLISGAAPFIAIMAIAALRAPDGWFTYSNQDVGIMAAMGVAVGFAVRMGLFGARCVGISVGKALLIPAIFIPAVTCLALSFAAIGQRLSAAANPYAFAFGPQALFTIALIVICVTSYSVVRFSRTRASGA